MNIQFTLAWRYLRGRKVRSLLTVLAVVFGVMITFGMNGIVPAVRASFDESVRVSAHQVDLIVTPDSERVFPASVAGIVAETPGVAAVTSVLERPLRLPASYQIPTTEARPIAAIVVNGWDPETSQIVVPITPIAGRWLLPGETNTAMVLESLLKQTNLELGDTLRLPAATGSVSFEIVGVLPERALKSDEEVYISLESAQSLFNLPNQINAIAGQLVSDDESESVSQAVLARLGAGFTIGRVESGGQEWEAVLQVAEVVFTMFGLLAMAMGGFIIFNTFRTSVTERKHDIGMLRAIGASRRTVLGLVLSEGLLIGIIGTCIGMLVGYLAVSSLLPLVNPAWQQFFGAPLGSPAFAPRIYALTVGLGLGIPLLSGLAPALSASRVTPLEALRAVPAEVSWSTFGKRAVFGASLISLAFVGLLTGQVALVGLGALFFLIGLMLLSSALVQPIASLLGQLLARFASESHMAQRNMTRHPGRAAVTASAMMISLAILVALAGLATTFTGGLMGYLERSMRADYLLLPEALVLGQANVGAGPELAQRLRTTPGIAGVTTIRRGEVQLENGTVQLIGIDPATYPQLAGLVFTGGKPEQAYNQIGQGRAMIINGLLAAQARLTIGQTVGVPTANGQQMFTIVGIGADYLNSRVPTAYVSHENLAQALGVTNDVLLMANRATDAPADEVESALLDLVREYPAFSLLEYADWRQSQLEANQTRTNIMYVLMAILALPSLLALANTLGINVLERTREIGMLRAIGGTRRQIRRMIMTESVLLAVMGTLFGILAGVWLGYALVGAINVAGFVFAYVFPTLGIVVAVVVGLLFGVLAAVLPARHAARLNIVSALRYE